MARNTSPKRNRRLPLKGFLKVSLLDYPGKIASMVFLGGCNFRCPFCYNVDLVKRPDKLPDVKEKEIFDYLKEKKNWVDAVVLGGGEPTLYPELLNFCRKLKKLGLDIQIQTNGTNPALLSNLISQNLVDYLAMDIKGPLEKYEEIVKKKVDKEKIQKSVELIKSNYPKIESEFRTTIVPKLLNKKDIEKIGRWLKNSKVPYFLQQFRPDLTLDPAFSKIKPYKKEELEEMKKIAKKYLKKVELRGI